MALDIEVKAIEGAEAERCVDPGDEDTDADSPLAPDIECGSDPEDAADNNSDEKLAPDIECASDPEDAAIDYCDPVIQNLR